MSNVQVMKLSEGVEWAVHCCLNLSWISRDRPVAAARLAAFYNLPAAYLSKQMQALVRAGIVSSTSGPRGGFRLARGPEKITLMDVVAAIEGTDRAFRCTDMRRQGPSGELDALAGYHPPCAVSQAFTTADMAWRRRLAAQTVADLATAVRQTTPAAPERVRHWFAHART